MSESPVSVIAREIEEIHRRLDKLERDLRVEIGGTGAMSTDTPLTVDVDAELTVAELTVTLRADGAVTWHPRSMAEGDVLLALYRAEQRVLARAEKFRRFRIALRPPTEGHVPGWSEEDGRFYE